MIALPTEWTLEQAAAIPESGSVALQAVRDRGRVRGGQAVAIIGAGGGVGVYAVQIAKGLGADVSHALSGPPRGTREGRRHLRRHPLARTDGLLGLDVFRREVGDPSEPVGHIEAYPP